MLKVALVGAGGISGAHIPCWQSMDDAELVALCDIRKENMEQYPDIRQYTDFEEMIQKEKPDIVDICLPTYLHTEYALRAMKKGIHVLCEKPVSLQESDVKLLYDTARENHVTFMVAQVLRFWREYETIKQLYDSQKYGKLLSGTMRRLNQRPQWSWDGWMGDESRSGLVAFDLHIHDLDFLIYAFGIPKNKQSFRSKRPEQDYLQAVYVYDDFFVGTEASWYAAPYPFQMEFRFQFEHAVAAMEDGKMLIYEDNGTVVDLSEHGSNEMGNINLPSSNAYANEIRYFTDCVKLNKEADKVKQQELEAVIQILKQI